MTIKINYIKALESNYIWLIEQENQVIIVDPGVDQKVIEYLKENQLIPIAIIITHSHSDHIAGIAGIKKEYPNIIIIGTKYHGIDLINYPINENAKFNLMNLNFETYSTPGHCKNHIVYYITQLNSLFCGDVIFPCGCGRIFDGLPTELFYSLRFIAENFNDNTKLYSGHEYGLNNAKFALNFDQNNKLLKARYEMFKILDKQPTSPTTVGEEKETNIFLRVHKKNIINNVAIFLPNTDMLTVFTFLRKEKDKF